MRKREREEREAKAKEGQKQGVVDAATQRPADFATLLWRYEDKSVDWIKPCTVLTNNDTSQDYTPIFLAHAELFVFADIWGQDMQSSLYLSDCRRRYRTSRLFDN